MRIVITIVCTLITFYACANEYDECVLTGIKGVSSDTGARLVAQACKNKINEAKKSKRKSFGPDIDPKDYLLITGNNSVQRYGDGFFSQALENRSSRKTITYVAFTVRDGDFYDFKPAEKRGQKAPRNDPLDGVFDSMDRASWEHDRTHVHYYKLAVKPGKTIRLKFPPPKSDTFYSEITMILGRETKWSDTMQQLKDEVSPEANDPLE